jgi:thymidylate kinase
MKGRFIVICGMNNLGKTTVLSRLMKHLKKSGMDVIFLKYPIYDLEPTGSRINKYLRGGNPEKLNSFTAQKIYVQNRRDFEPQLISTLEKGTTVVAEDYVGTGIVWGMLGGASLEEMEELNKGLIKADLTILLDGDRFLTGVEDGHTHENAMEVWDRGRKIHLDLAEKYGWKIVNANQSRIKVLKDVIKIIDNYGQNI